MAVFCSAYIPKTNGVRYLSASPAAENALALPRQTDTQVDRRYGLGNSALLIADGRDFFFFDIFL